MSTNLKTVARSVLPVVLLLALSACGGGGAKVEANTTTMGQELMDLDASYKKGLLTEDEYNKARKRIMKKYN